MERFWHRSAQQGNGTLEQAAGGEGFSTGTRQAPWMLPTCLARSPSAPNPWRSEERLVGRSGAKRDGWAELGVCLSRQTEPQHLPQPHRSLLQLLHQELSCPQELLPQGWTPT